MSNVYPPTPQTTSKPRLGAMEYSLIAVMVVALGIMFSGRLPGGEPPNTLGPAASVADFKSLGNLPPLQLTTLDGANLTNQDFAGKVVVLHFWGTRCGPCLQELPSLRQEYRDTLGADDRLLLVGLASDQDRGLVERFVKSRGIPFPVVASDTPAAVDLWKALGVEFTPATIIANGKGEMVWAGEKVPRNLAEIVDQLATS